MTISDQDRQRLCQAALDVAPSAYAPYSKFRVGAAVLGSNIHVGVNVENATYGASLCAERAAITAAVAAGDLPIRAIALGFADVNNSAPINETVPCGICRQWIAEIAPDSEIIICGSDKVLRLPDLLPLPFHLHRRPGS